MVSRYSEEEAVQKPAGELLARMGWDVVFCFDDEVLGDNGTLGRANYGEVVLRRDLKEALLKFNAERSEEDCEVAINTLLETLSTDSLLQTNEKKYFMLREGIPFDITSDKGEKRTEHLRVFDFNNPENNKFTVAEELWVQGDLYKRRCDLVGFVNGIPLLFVEFKRHDRDVLRAYEDNYSDYQQTIPQIFFFNAFVILSNGLEAKLGTLGSSFEFFIEWKRLKEGGTESVALETMLRGVCDKTAFMDIFENFILFDRSSAPTSKIIARNHQYLGVNEAVLAYEKRKLNDGKLGVFWHTQGSGKSYSMVFFARKIRRKFSDSPTFLVVTDRDELDKQISDTFGDCGCMGKVAASEFRATSAKDLENKLKGNPSFIFTLIQKFNDPNAAPIKPNHEIIILSDEAHRTNNGFFAENMCKMLPTASRLGFTGTPLFTYDNITERTFGGYVSVYDFQDAVDDGATVPLFYENRSESLGINNPEINDRLSEAIEAADLDDSQREKLERDIARELHIITSKHRLETIAKDFVEHYSGIWESGKAMFICVDKVTTVRMFDFVQKYWKEAITKEEAALKNDTQQEAMERKRKITWMKETEMAVVISQEQNEISAFEKRGLDIRPHRKKMIDRELEKDFKNSDHPFRVVFVCAMWLTGFDVKPLSTIYFDKPLKAHALMQAIARANRVNKGKSNGLIVDYIGVVKALRGALAQYTRKPESGGTVDPVHNKDELLERVKSLFVEIESFFADSGFDFNSLVTAEGFNKLAKIREAADAVSAGDERKKRFGIMGRELFKLFKFIEPKELDYECIVKRDAVNAVYNEVNKTRAVADISGVMAGIQQIIDEYVVVKDDEEKETVTIDISKINFKRLRMEFRKMKQKNLFVNDLRQVIEKRLEIALRENPKNIDFYKKYEEIIERYNSEQNRANIEKIFEDLLAIVEGLSKKEKEYIEENFDNPQHKAVFDMLYKESLTKREIEEIKKVSKELVKEIQKRLAEMVKWEEKPESQAVIKVIIRNKLFDLPERSYPDNSMEEYRNKIFEYFFNYQNNRHFGGSARV